jgi:two-component system phosphate regulon sensor histidine kinase PhoR
MGVSGTMRAGMALAAAALGITLALAAGAPLPAAVATLTGGFLAALAIFWPSQIEAEPGTAGADTPSTLPLPAADEVLEAVSDPVLLVRERRVIAANQAARALLGRHIVGADVLLAIRHPAAAERLIAETGERTRIDLTGLAGEDRRWQMAVDPLADGTRLVRLADRSAAHASEKMRSDFVANASHELRTPLATLVGYSETMLDERSAPEGATRRRFLKVIHDEARRMQRLVEDLISLSRIEAERFDVPSEPVRLLPLVEEVRDACGRLLAEKGTKLIVDSAIRDPAVRGDRSQLLQLVQNLVDNALKYGRAGSEIRIGIEPRGERMLRLSVTDQGEGIAAEHLPRLTERFYRVDTGRSRSMGGTGLGLAIVKHIAGRHKGSVEIRSRLGEGTIVLVDLPSLSSKSHRNITEEPSRPDTEPPDDGQD